MWIEVTHGVNAAPSPESGPVAIKREGKGSEIGGGGLLGEWRAVYYGLRSARLGSPAGKVLLPDALRPE